MALRLWIAAASYPDPRTRALVSCPASWTHNAFGLAVHRMIDDDATHERAAVRAWLTARPRADAAAICEVNGAGGGGPRAATGGSR